MTLRMRLSTYRNLGIGNVIRVALYRVGLRSGLHPVQKVKGVPARGPFFHPPANPAPQKAVPRRAWDTEPEYFGRTAQGATFPPDWYANVSVPDARAEAALDWWRISDFDPRSGDIKAVWEASRFDWVIAMAQRAVCGRPAEVARLNDWLSEWTKAVPPYRGANWKCGQEASIRVLHLVLAAQILGQVKDPLPGLVDLIRQHLVRIAPTLGYAIGQQNNHGTSEAAALYVGGSFLAQQGDKKGKHWQKRGERQLAERALALIEPDGTFSQYSVTYHRVMLDTYSFAEAWRRHQNLPQWSEEVRERLGQAADWLHRLTDVQSGDAPNLGANDGARLIPLTDTDYRDFRPCAHLAQTLFRDRVAYEDEGDWDQPLIWLGIARPETLAQQSGSVTLDNGGLHILRMKKVAAYLRYPRFRFRPVQADALHLDLWVDGENVLRDGGTYSYNVSEADAAYFNGTAGHNTIEMDGRDQMPRIGRFLFGDWLKAQDVEPVREEAGAVTASAGYRDRWGASHNRQITLEENRLICIDRIKGFEKSAVLRLRLCPGEWRQEEDTVTDGVRSIRVKYEDGKACPLSLTTGQESRYYLLKTPVPVIKVALERPGTVTTEIRF